MLALRLLFLLLTILQYVTNPAFWQTHFYWLFILIIAFQLNWYYIDKPIYKKIMLGIIALFSLINLLVLPGLPILLVGLLVMDVRKVFGRRGTVLAGIGYVALCAGMWAFLGDWPTTGAVISLVGVMAVSAWAASQHQALVVREEERYDQLMTHQSLQEKADMLKLQMDSMQEIYTLNERNRISRDLHDSVGHTLSTLVIQIAAISKLTEQSSPEASKMLDDLHGFTKDGLANVRQVIHEMKPAKYGQFAFIEQIDSLIRDFEANSQISVYFNHNDIRWELSQAQEVTVYRAIQEFMGNSTKHSRATEIRIQYHFTDSLLILTMTDNGQGTGEIKTQMGLSGMKERAKLIGGKVTIQSATGAGFKIRLVLPKGGIVNDTNQSTTRG